MFPKTILVCKVQYITFKYAELYLKCSLEIKFDDDDDGDDGDDDDLGFLEQA